MLCVQRAGERAGARMWRGHARASHPFRITGRDERVIAARVVVRVAVVRLRASRSRGGAEGFVPLSDGEGAGEDEGGGAACDT